MNNNLPFPNQASIELTVIINSFNRLPLLRLALPSVVKALGSVWSAKSAVIVFDAGSTDGSIEFVEEQAVNCRELPIFCLCPPADADRSFSGGCNFAVQFAGQHFPQLKWCFLFETDNLIHNASAISLAVNLLEQEPELAGVGFTVEGNSFCSRFPNSLAFILGLQLSHFLGLEKMKIKNWNYFADVRWGISEVVYSSPILIRYLAWQATNGMDAAQFPFSDCDVDWCWVIYKKGWRLAVLDIPGVIHDNRMTASAWSQKRVINFHQARFRLLLKHRGQWIALLKPLLILRHTMELFLLFFLCLLKPQFKNSFDSRFDMLKTAFIR